MESPRLWNRLWNRLAHVHGRTLGRGEQGGELRFSGDALTLTRGAKLDVECPAR